MKAILILILFFAGAGMSSAQPKPETQLKHKAIQEVQNLATALKGVLKNEMKTNGPLAAISQCNTFPAAYKNGLGENDGWSVGRTSLKVRNPDNQPLLWQESVLKDFDLQLANGSSPQEIEYSKLVKVDGGHEYRYMKAIPIKKMCLACHGQTIAEPVLNKLKVLYPNDQATGYTERELRGAFAVSKYLPQEKKSD